MGRRLGSKVSDETKAKMRLSRLGKTSWNKGKKFSLEHRQRISKALKGIKRPGVEKNFGESISRKGSKCHLWKGGITPLNLAIRTSREFRQWRSDVFTRDNFTCQWCGDDRGGNLNADHIKPFSILLQEYEITSLDLALKCEALWNINNGRTLCKSCHQKTDSFGMRKKNLQLEMI